MNDKQIEKFILSEIIKRKITFYDMIYGRCISYESNHKRVVRDNMFESENWAHRLLELTGGRVTVQEFIRFWWNNCIYQDDMIDLILEEVFLYFKDKLSPEEENNVTNHSVIDFPNVIPVGGRKHSMVKEDYFK